MRLRFSPFAQSEPARQVWNVRWQACLSDHTTLENMVSFARDHHLLPEAYLYGFVFTNEERDKMRFAQHSSMANGVTLASPRFFRAPFFTKLRSRSYCF